MKKLGHFIGLNVSLSALLIVAASGCADSKFATGSNSARLNPSQSSSNALPVIQPSGVAGAEQVDKADKQGPNPSPSGTSTSSAQSADTLPANPTGAQPMPSGDTAAPGAGSKADTAKAAVASSGSGAAQTAAIRATCDDLASPQSSVLKLTQNAAGVPVRTTFAGEICPLATGSLTVVFIIDWSGSMNQNDPLKKGSCGRLQAIQAVSDYITKNAGSNIAVREALVPFSDQAMTKSIINPTDLKTFQSQMTAANICRASGSTNYADAFTTASSVLRNIKGRVVVYFISDGLPTVYADGKTQAPAGSPSIKDVSIAAGQKLRSDFTGLTVNGILLGQGAAQARDVLEKITGSAARVKLVSGAEDLATEIVKFPAPQFVAGSAQGTLTVAGQAPKAVKVLNLALDANHPGHWTFQTEPFDLTGPAKSSSSATLAISATDSDGVTDTVAATLLLQTN